MKHLSLALVASALLAQPAPSQVAATPDAVSVYLDCSFHCDTDYIRTEITHVSWVRDRAVADVHMLVTSQGTAGGGT